MKSWIMKVYTFWCYKLWQRREFFTPQLTRLMIAHGISFWFVFYGAAGYCFYHSFNKPSFTEAAACIFGLVFLSWLSDHLNDYSRLHPENTINRRAL
jgi:hypothetical protein